MNLPPGAADDIRVALAFLRAELMSVPLEPKYANRVRRALEAAGDEVASAQPDREEIGQALQRALEAARNADAFADIVDRLVPHIGRVAAWLGSTWNRQLAGGEPPGAGGSAWRDTLYTEWNLWVASAAPLVRKALEVVLFLALEAAIILVIEWTVFVKTEGTRLQLEPVVDWVSYWSSVGGILYYLSFFVREAARHVPNPSHLARMFSRVFRGRRRA